MYSAHVTQKPIKTRWSLPGTMPIKEIINANDM